MARFEVSQLADWEQTKPWNQTRQQAAHQLVPGFGFSRARGSEAASYEQGMIRLKPEFFDYPEGTRRAICYHEAGHAITEVTGTPSLDLLDLPGASILGYNVEEVIAEGFSVMMVEPSWLKQYPELEAHLFRAVRAAGFPTTLGGIHASRVSNLVHASTELDHTEPTEGVLGLPTSTAARLEDYWDRSGDEPVWAQPYDDLLSDALYEWKGSNSSLGIWMNHVLDDPSYPASNGTAKIWKAQAAALINEVRAGDPAPTLYRGDTREPVGFLGWSENRETAERFAKMGGGDVWVLEQGRGLEIERYAPGSGLNQDEQEWIVETVPGQARRDSSISATAFQFQGITLYHGTVGYYANKILSEGLSPRTETGVTNHWNGDAESWGGRVYFSLSNRLTISRRAYEEARKNVYELKYGAEEARITEAYEEGKADIYEELTGNRPFKYSDTYRIEFWGGQDEIRDEFYERIKSLRSKYDLQREVEKTDPDLQPALLKVTLTPDMWENLTFDEDTRMTAVPTVEQLAERGQSFPEWMGSLGADSVVAYIGSVPPSKIERVNGLPSGWNVPGMLPDSHRRAQRTAGLNGNLNGFVFYNSAEDTLTFVDSHTGINAPFIKGGWSAVDGAMFRFEGSDIWAIQGNGSSGISTNAWHPMVIRGLERLMDEYPEVGRMTLHVTQPVNGYGEWVDNPNGKGRRQLPNPTGWAEVGDTYSVWQWLSGVNHLRAGASLEPKTASTTLYRGISFVTKVDAELMADLDGVLQRRIIESARRRGAGLHWTSDLSVAERFAGGQYGVTHLYANNWGLSMSVPVVLSASIPVGGVNVDAPGSKMYVMAPESAGEAEVPIRPGAQLNVNQISYMVPEDENFLLLNQRRWDRTQTFDGRTVPGVWVDSPMPMQLTASKTAASGASLAAAFASQNPQLASQAGAMYQCEDVSTAFEAFVRSKSDTIVVKHIYADHPTSMFEVDHDDWGEWLGADGYEGEPSHSATLIGGIVYDFTARQFWPSAPFPLIESLDDYRRRWVNLDVVGSRVASKTAAKGYTGYPEMDAAIEEFLDTPLRELGGDTVRMVQAEESRGHGVCQIVSEEFEAFCKAKGIDKVYATHTDLEEMGYTIQPGSKGGEIGFDENDEMVYGHYPEHTVNTYYPPGSNFPIVIDFTATQYGYPEMVKISSTASLDKTADMYFDRVSMPNSLSGWKAHVFTETVEEIEMAWNRIKSDVEGLGWGCKLATQAALDAWKGSPQWGKGVTVYFPHRETAEADIEYLVRLMAGWPDRLQKPIANDDKYVGNGVSVRYEFHTDPGYDIEPGDVNRWYKAASAMTRLGAIGEWDVAPDDDWYDGPVAGTYDPSQPVYLRFGRWDERTEQSRNHVDGTLEVGVSVYDLDGTSPLMHYVYENESDLDPDDPDYFYEEPRDPWEGLIDRIGEWRQGAWFVQGDLVGTGYDGEALLRNVRAVGEVMRRGDIGPPKDFPRRASKTAAAKLVGRCSICGERIQRNGEGARWKHQRPNPDGSPRDHPPKTAALDTITLYHGTSRDRAELISRDGMNMARSPRMTLTDSFEGAAEFASLRKPLLLQENTLWVDQVGHSDMAWWEPCVVEIEIPMSEAGQYLGEDESYSLNTGPVKGYSTLQPIPARYVKQLIDVPLLSEVFHGYPGPPRYASKTAALDNEARISVSEHVMENHGLEGRYWFLEEGHVDDPGYQATMQPLRDFVARVVGHPVNVHVSNYSLDRENNAQAMVTPTGTLFVRPEVSMMTVLHECAHILNRSTHGEGHDDAFIEIAADLYERYISPEAAEQFLSLAYPIEATAASALDDRIPADPGYITIRHSETAGVYIHWLDPHTEIGRLRIERFPGMWQITGVEVREEWRRKGIASNLLQMARDRVGHVEHDTSLTDDAVAWKAVVGLSVEDGVDSYGEPIEYLSSDPLGSFQGPQPGWDGPFYKGIDSPLADGVLNDHSLEWWQASDPGTIEEFEKGEMGFWFTRDRAEAEGYGDHVIEVQLRPGGWVERPGVWTGDPSAYANDIRDISVVGSVDEYGGGHQPHQGDPGIWELDKIMPEDVYSHNGARYYGHGGGNVYDIESHAVVMRVRDDPNATVTIYRSVPPNVKEFVFDTGNWVAVSQSYADMHGEMRGYEWYDGDSVWTSEFFEGENKGEWKKVETDWVTMAADVPASTIRSGGNDIIEYGYWGPKVQGRIVSGRPAPVEHQVTTQEERNQKWGRTAAVVKFPEIEQAGVHLWVTHNGDHLALSSVKVPSELRGRGLGTAAVKAVMERARQEGIAVTLTPEAYGAGDDPMSTAQLRRWYESLGFVRNRSSNKLWSSRDSHVWHPVAEVFAKTSAVFDEYARCTNAVYEAITGEVYPTEIRDGMEVLQRIREAGHRWHWVADPPAKTVKGLMKLVEQGEYTEGSYYFFSAGHAMALVDGVLIDTEFRGADNRRILGFYPIDQDIW